MDLDMMRLTMAVWWSLALVWLLAGTVEADPTPGEPARRVEVAGYGTTTEIAKKNALQAAVLEVHKQARDLRLTHWRATDNYVAEHLLEGPGRAGPDETIVDLVTKTWVHAVRLPDEATLLRLERQAQRQDRAEARMSLALRILACMIFVLAGLVGAIRLDEWTEARYTAVLRVAAAAVLVAAGVGWWWMG